MNAYSCTFKKWSRSPLPVANDSARLPAPAVWWLETSGLCARDAARGVGHRPGVTRYRMCRAVAAHLRREGAHGGSTQLLARIQRPGFGR